MNVQFDVNGDVYLALRKFISRVWAQNKAHRRSTRAQNKKVQQKRHSSKYLSAFLQAIRHQSRHPG